MTLRTIQSKIKARFKDGKGRSVIKGKPGCWYKTPSGNACPVGCLIPSGAYVPQAEGWYIGFVRPSKRGAWEPREPGTKPLAEMLNLAMIPATKEVYALLVRAQDLHDDPKNWNGKTYIGLLV